VSGGGLLAGKDGESSGFDPEEMGADVSDDLVRRLVSLSHLVGTLKHIRRRGWLLRGVDGPDAGGPGGFPGFSVESVADHSYRVSFMAMVTGRVLGLDVEKMVSMALLHDVGEVVVGDITPVDGVDEEKKRSMEEGAVRGIFSALSGVVDEDGRALRPRAVDLWLEFENGVSPEAILVRDLDRVEMALQAVEYARRFVESSRGGDVDVAFRLEEFVTAAAREVKTGLARRMMAVVKEEWDSLIKPL